MFHVYVHVCMRMQPCVQGVCAEHAVFARVYTRMSACAYVGGLVGRAWG